MITKECAKPKCFGGICVNVESFARKKHRFSVQRDAVEMMKESEP